MTPPLKQGATLPQPGWPGFETNRLILRQWRESDITANTEMLSDPLSGRFITADRKPVTEPMAGWRNSALFTAVYLCSRASWSSCPSTSAAGTAAQSAVLARS